MEIKDGRYQIECEDADLSRSAFVRVTLAGSSFRDADLSGLVVLPAELPILLLPLLVGSVAALIPAWRAYRSDIAATLSGA